MIRFHDTSEKKDDSELLPPPLLFKILNHPEQCPVRKQYHSWMDYFRSILRARIHTP